LRPAFDPKKTGKLVADPHELIESQVSKCD